MSEKTHELKLRDWFVDDILSGRKRFEIRDNDRLFQRGDLVRFVPVDGDGLRSGKVLDDRLYRITFVESGYGLCDGYVAFGFEEVSWGERLSTASIDAFAKEHANERETLSMRRLRA